MNKQEVRVLIRKLFNAALTILVLSSVLFILTSSVYADFGDTTLKKGMKHPDIRLLQEKLNMLGYYEDEEFDESFGSKTLDAVLAFQRDSMIEQDGIVGKNTYKMLETKIKQVEIIPEDFVTLKEGDSGETVMKIREKLQDIELLTDEITESFDTALKEAVIKFQAIEGITQTGEVDVETMIRLNIASNKAIAKRALESRRVVNANIIDYAKQYLGTPYKWGASSGKAFDCSGFVVYVMKKFDVDLKRRASEQFKGGIEVAREDLQPGDLVFFTTYKKGPSHVGIYIGNNEFIHASSGHGRVMITSLNSSYYKPRYLGARRYAPTKSD